MRGSERTQPTSFNVEGKRFGLVTARFNSDITGALRDGTLRCFQQYQATVVSDIWVPGAVEIPLAAQRLVRENQLDGVVCLGCVIRGDTAHFDYVCDAVTQGVVRVSLDESVPVVFGVLTTDTHDQALLRAGDGSDNKGYEAALTALEMA